MIWFYDWYFVVTDVIEVCSVKITVGSESIYEIRTIANFTKLNGHNLN